MAAANAVAVTGKAVADLDEAAPQRGDAQEKKPRQELPHGILPSGRNNSRNATMYAVAADP